MLVQQLMNGLSTGLIYGLLALGFSLAYSTTRVINFAHGEFFTLGAFLGITLQRWGGLSPIAAAIVAALSVTAVAAAFAYGVLWRLPSALTRAVATIAASLALRDGMLLAFGSDTASFSTSSLQRTVSVLTVVVPRYTLDLTIWTAVLLIALWLLLKRTRIGVHMRATAQDRELAASAGIRVRHVEAIAFGVAALGAAAAGLLIGPSWQVNFAAGSIVGVKAFTAAMVGGLGRLGGAVIGGILLGLTEAIFAGYVSSAWKDLAVFMLLLLTLLWFPRGLFSFRAQRLGSV
jgi:branched-chain amino acid transport system permease protein